MLYMLCACLVVWCGMQAGFYMLCACLVVWCGMQAGFYMLCACLVIWCGMQAGFYMLCACLVIWCGMQAGFYMLCACPVVWCVKMLVHVWSADDCAGFYVHAQDSSMSGLVWYADCRILHARACLISCTTQIVGRIMMLPPCLCTGSFQEQLSSYVQQLETADHQDWVKEAIEKEKLKKRHLQVVIQHLESEVSNLSKETIRQMEESMMQVQEVLALSFKPLKSHIAVANDVIMLSLSDIIIMMWT